MKQDSALSSTVPKLETERRLVWKLRARKKHVVSIPGKNGVTEVQTFSECLKDCSQKIHDSWQYCPVELSILT